MAMPTVEGAGVGGRVGDRGDDQHRDRCDSRHEERHGPGVVGGLGEENEERAESQARSDTECKRTFGCAGQADVAASDEPHCDRSHTDPRDRNRAGSVTERDPDDQGTVAATTALSGLTSRFGPSANPW